MGQVRTKTLGARTKGAVTLLDALSEGKRVRLALAASDVPATLPVRR